MLTGRAQCFRARPRPIHVPRFTSAFHRPSTFRVTAACHAPAGRQVGAERVLDEMRKLRPDVPVVMMSGHADEQFAQHARSHGAFDYLATPFSVDRFVGVLTAALK
jgi:CheY-like chemotaxis protein